LKYLKYFEKYEEFKKSEIVVRKATQSISVKKFAEDNNFHVGDKVIVNGKQNGLKIEDQIGKVVYIPYHLNNSSSGFLIKFDNKFNNRLHNGNGRIKELVCWYVNPNNVTIEHVDKSKKVIPKSLEKKEKIDINIISFNYVDMSFGKHRINIEPDSNYYLGIDARPRKDILPIAYLPKNIIKEVQEYNIADYETRYNGKYRIIAYLDEVDEKLIIRKITPKMNGLKTRLRNSIKKLEARKLSLGDKIETLEKYSNNEEGFLEDIKNKILNSEPLRKPDTDWEPNEDEEDDNIYDGIPVNVLFLRRNDIRIIVDHIAMYNDRTYTLANERRMVFNRDVFIRDHIANIGSIIIYLDDKKERAYQISKEIIKRNFRNDLRQLKYDKSNYESTIKILEKTKVQLETLSNYNARDILHMENNTKLSLTIPNMRGYY
jgi:hypothetical protein